MAKKRLPTIPQNARCSQGPSSQRSIPLEEGGRHESQVDSINEVGGDTVSTKFNIAQSRPFNAGRIQEFFANSQNITSDSTVLDMVKGCTLEFATYPHHTCHPKEIKFSLRECLAIKIELQRLLDKGIIIPSEHETCEFISTIFVRPKADGSFRLILNLKRLNDHIVYHHFKMESLKSVIQLMEKDCFMASVDLRDAYYSIPMSVHAHKYLKFTWGGKLYQFTCLPNGLC